LKKNIIVVSARRSGTHLLVDLIVNNFGYESINYNYIDYPKFTDEIPKLESAMSKGGQVTWTHAHNYQDYYKFNHKIEDQNKLDKFFKESKIILIYRDTRDIINSCYHRPRYKNKYKSFLDFYENFDFDGYELVDQKYKNIFELLLQYYKNWFSVYMSKELLDLDMEIISYEQIINKYHSSVNDLSFFLDQPIDNIVDVRLPNRNKNKNITYTTNDFRIGKVGDWANTFPPELGEKLGEKYYIDLEAGLDCFINDIKIHKYHTPERHKFENPSGWKLVKNDIKIPFELSINIENRYRDSLQRSTDFRYYHKVFYYNDYILKFHYPCKASLDKPIFDLVVPIASNQQLSTILKTNEFLYEKGIVPRLYYAGIYKGVLFIIQERYNEDDILYNRYNIHPKWGDWNWVVDLNLYSDMVKHFNKALEHNIVLTDLFNVYNCAYNNNGDLKYFDLDGIKHFNSKEEMINSEEYKNAMGIFSEINKYNIFINTT